MPKSEHGGYLAPDRPVRAEDLPKVPEGPAQGAHAGTNETEED